MQEIILKVLAGIGGASILLLGVFVLIEVSSFFADFDSFKFETDLLLKFLKRDVCNLQEWKQKIVKIIAEHQDSVNKQIKEESEKQDKFYLQMFDELREQRFDDMKSIDKMESRITDRIKNLETSEGLYKKTIDELTERERAMSKTIEELAKNDIMPNTGHVERELDGLKEEAGDKISDLERTAKELETRIEVMEIMLEELTKNKGEQNA